MSKKSYVEGFCKTAESHGIDPMALAALVAHMEKNAGILGDLAANWAQLSPGARMAISAAGTGAVGAGIGSLFGKPKKKKLAALIGLLAGGATGAASSAFLDAPKWLQGLAIKGTKGKMTGDVNKDNDTGKNLLRWLAESQNEEGAKLLNESANLIGTRPKISLPWWGKGESIEGPQVNFDIDSLSEAIDRAK